MKYSATITVQGSRELVFGAFSAENSEIKAERSSYTMRKEKGAVVFDVKASDAVAFRAAISSISKMLAVIEKAKG